MSKVGRPSKLSPADKHEVRRYREAGVASLSEDQDIDLSGAFNDGFELKNNWGTIMKALFAVFLLFVCYRVMGDTVTYQSQTLAGVSTIIDGPSTLNNPVNDAYIITVQLAGPLAPNLNMAMITPQSWVVTCTQCQAPLSSSPENNVSPPMVYMTATSAVFLFSTDATGKITAWNFSISGNAQVTDGQIPLGIYSQPVGTFTSGDVGTSNNWENGHQYIVTTSGPKGTWTQSSLANPAPAAPAVLARTCNGTWGVPSNTVAGGLTPNANGTGMNCRMPSAYPGAWFIKVTPDGGKTYEFVTLSSLGLGNGK